MTTAFERPDILSIIRAENAHPFDVLGMHQDQFGTPVVRSFQPRASRVEVLTAAGELAGELGRLHPDGFFEGWLLGRSGWFPYRLRLHLPEGVIDADDPYRFPPVLGDLDIHLLAEGTHLRLYERLGSHPMEVDGVAGTAFAVWAPNAWRVAVVGAFNNWDGRVHPMRRRPGAGVWELFLPGIAAGARYMYEVKDADGQILPLKADPYAIVCDQPPSNASVVHRGVPARDWQDQAWMARRAEFDVRSAPLSVYEVHLGSWRRVPEQRNRYLTYAELAERLVPYVVDMGFTHIELLPIAEHPFDGSWGYQPTGMYAPTSRFGSPEDFQLLIDQCHQAGIGVILDWVPGHFPNDPQGMGWFDGTALYEHPDPRRGFHPQWNTLIYNYGRAQVVNFLLGNALYWLERFHIDGLRVDAVASMLYLDFARNEGEWLPNANGGNENLEAVAFLRRLNAMLRQRCPGAMTAAEESSTWPGVTRSFERGGLGFNLKWNMGWMNDTLKYMAEDPIFRCWHHGKLTFGLHYAFTERFILPLSHDEVVHGKGSMLGKMPGDHWRKFANLRAYYGFMWTHPGKKLLFMGGEFAQWREWDHDGSLDWHLLDYPTHAGVQRVVRDLNALYRRTPALYQRDADPEGFEWIDADDAQQSLLAYLRRGWDSAPPVLVLCNFTPVPRPGFRIGVPECGAWTVRLNTDDAGYGGTGMGIGDAEGDGIVLAEGRESHGRPWSLVLTLPPLATVILEPCRDARPIRTKVAPEPEVPAATGTTAAEPEPPAPEPEAPAGIETTAAAPETAATESEAPAGEARVTDQTPADQTPAPAPRALPRSPAGQGPRPKPDRGRPPRGR